MITWKLLPTNEMQQAPIVWRKLDDGTEESCLITVIKKEILADEAQLQDADGNVMADAKDYVRTLP